MTFFSLDWVYFCKKYLFSLTLYYSLPHIQFYHSIQLRRMELFIWRAFADVIGFGQTPQFWVDLFVKWIILMFVEHWGCLLKTYLPSVSALQRQPASASILIVLLSLNFLTIYINIVLWHIGYAGNFTDKIGIVLIYFIGWLKNVVFTKPKVYEYICFWCSNMSLKKLFFDVEKSKGLQYFKLICQSRGWPFTNTYPIASHSAQAWVLLFKHIISATKGPTFVP